MAVDRTSRIPTPTTPTFPGLMKSSHDRFSKSTPSAFSFVVRTTDDNEVRHIALIGNYSPQQCGIATFTADTRTAMRLANDDIQIDTYAMDDGSIEKYPAAVTDTIIRERTADYTEKAHDINRSGAQLCWLQHEYGIFGGADGEHILALVDELTVPLVITLHTVLTKPTDNQRRVLLKLAQKAELLIVMARHGRNTLQDVYGISADKIVVIPHGIPDCKYVDPDTAKPELGFTQRKVVLTFGLLSHDKGIGYMIDAMPAIVRADPSVIYVVLGATHPHLLANEGEALRESLQQRARNLGVEDHVRWVNAFVELDELTRYLQAADVYVTPYLNPMQVTSGTLAYATGLGKPVVSTPYVHASELLTNGNGKLVPFKEAAALAEEVSTLLADNEARSTMAAAAYQTGRTMTWDSYAQAVLARFARVINGPALAKSASTTYQTTDMTLHNVA